MGRLKKERDNVLDEGTKKKLAEKNIPLVHHIVKKFKNTGIEYNELLSVGMLGLAKALNTYEKDRRTKFTTYAYKCIINEILMFLKERNKQIETISMNTILSSDKHGNELLIEEIINDEGLKTVETNMNGLEEDIIAKEEYKVLLEVVNELSEQERLFIIHRYGLFGVTPKNQKDIGEILNLSQAQISKLNDIVLRKMKRMYTTKMIMLK